MEGLKIEIINTRLYKKRALIKSDMTLKDLCEVIPDEHKEAYKQLLEIIKANENKTQTARDMNNIYMNMYKLLDLFIFLGLKYHEILHNMKLNIKDFIKCNYSKPAKQMIIRETQRRLLKTKSDKKAYAYLDLRDKFVELL